MNTVQLRISVQPKQPWEDILTAELAEAGFDAFESTEEALLAYGPESQVSIPEVEQQILDRKKESTSELSYSFELIPYQNWNEKWEQGFEPVLVDDRLTILAPFHDRSLAKGLVIEIQPQMSFGTGHHQTTWLMAQTLLDKKTLPKRVLDMGTGTGVLAILAEKLGADEIIAIDIEDWSVVNAIENSERNTCKNIRCICGGKEKIEGKFDLILANINKNVLKDQMKVYSEALNQRGSLMISGFFDSDAEELISFLAVLQLQLVAKRVKETWAMLEFIKN